jgi:DNA-binding LytR/AlgR family response regulator
MIRIAFCDDETAWLKRTQDMLSAFAANHPEYPLQIFSFSSGEDLLRDVQLNSNYDIYLLDVVMPQMSGIDLGVNLRKHDEFGKIIYLTTSPDFAVDSYVTGAFYYLLKPATAEKVNDVLLRACAEISRRRERCMKIKTSAGLSILPFDEICFVELKRKSLLYYTAENHTLESTSVRESFSSCVSQLLEDKRFVLAGPGHCINLFYVKSVEKESLLFKNDIRLYLPRKICASIQAAWLDYWLEEGVRE